MKNIELDEYVKILIKDTKKSELRKQEINCKPKYILWLQEFTKRFPQFVDYEFVYDRKKITSNDFTNVHNLSLLYEVVERYAKENYLYVVKDDFSAEYKIKFGNIGYKIGVVNGQDTYYYCVRIDNPDNNFIDFNDIMNNNKQAHTDFITNKLNELANIITYYHEMGIPLSTLKQVINSTLQNIKEQDEAKDTKKLVKHL